MDAIDHKIMELLLQNARMSLKDIASQVFLSSTAVSTRMERLEEAGIIDGYHVSVNPLAVGYYTKAFINVDVDPIQKKEFYPFVEACPNVVECNCVTGDYSMLVEVIYKTTMELDSFINELQKFGKTKTMIVFSTSINNRESFWMEE